jgi:hypothetical protein
MDWIATLIIILLATTLLAFFYGAFAYPYGWLILIALLVARLSSKPIKKRR